MGLFLPNNRKRIVCWTHFCGFLAVREECAVCGVGACVSSSAGNLLMRTLLGFSVEHVEKCGCNLKTQQGSLEQGREGCAASVLPVEVWRMVFRSATPRCLE